MNLSHSNNFMALLLCTVGVFATKIFNEFEPITDDPNAGPMNIQFEGIFLFLGYLADISFNSFFSQEAQKAATSTSEVVRRVSRQRCFVGTSSLVFQPNRQKSSSFWRHGLHLGLKDLNDGGLKATQTQWEICSQLYLFFLLLNFDANRT